MSIKLDRGKLILIAIVLLAVFLRVFRLERADMTGDPAHYSFRSIGYLDFLDTKNQTTPLAWFGFRPAWSFLSFHDHPPLAFLIQHLFFKIFGVSTFIARLPFALFGAASVFWLFILAKKLYGRVAGYMSALLLAICSYHIWLSRSGYFEAILIFFLLAAFYYFLRALENPSYFYHFGIFLGLSCLTKYTAFFIVPVIGIYLLVWQRKIFSYKKFWLGLILAFFIFSPVVVYNLKMFQTRGHFDMQFAALFHQDMSDWPVIERGVSLNFGRGLTDIWMGLRQSFPPLYFFLFLASLAYVVFELFILKNKKREHSFLLLALLFATLFFVLTKADVYFISIYPVLAALFIAYLSDRLFGSLRKGQKYILGAILSLLFGYLLFFAINTNLAYRPRGGVNIWHASIRQENYGFEQLEQFLNEKIKTEKNYPKPIKTLDDIFLLNSQGAWTVNPEIKDVFVYDENLNWFARFWHFERRIVYQKAYFLSSAEYSLFKKWGGLEKMKSVFRDFYFIKTANNHLFDSKDYGTSSAQELENSLIDQSASPVYIINDPRGEAAFKIYKL